MTTNAYGNVLETPGHSQVAEVKPGDILAAYGAGILKKGVTVKTGQGVLAAGTVLGRETATKKYLAYDNANSPAGIGVARGVLMESVDTSDGDKLVNIIYGGTLKLSKLTGLDSNAITDLNGRTDAERDWFIF
jgi:hypothetical protein